MGPAGLDGVLLVDDLRCPLGGSVIVYQEGVPICHTEPADCEDQLVRQGRADGCSFAGASLYDVELSGLFGPYTDFSAIMTSASFAPNNDAANLPKLMTLCCDRTSFTAFNRARTSRMPC